MKDRDCLYENNNPTVMQHGYGAPNQSSYGAPIVSTKEWFITLLIMLIPIVNIVMLFVYAFGGSSNPSKANFFKANLILAAIAIGLWLLFLLFFVVILGLSLSS